MASLASTIMVATTLTRGGWRASACSASRSSTRWLSISARIAFSITRRALMVPSSLSILFCWRFWNSLAERASTAC